MGQNLKSNEFKSTTGSIEKSLQQLKQLEQLIKSRYFVDQHSNTGKRSSRAHSIASNQLFDLNLKSNPSFGPCPTPRPFNQTVGKKDKSSRNHHHNSGSYFSSQNCGNQIESIVQQNRRLRKDAKYLFEMNNFLKNELIKENIKVGVSNQFGELQRKNIKHLKRKKQMQINKTKVINSKIPISKKKKIFEQQQPRKKQTMYCFDDGSPIQCNHWKFSSLNPESTIDCSSFVIKKDANKAYQFSQREKQLGKRDHKKLGKKCNINVYNQVRKCSKMRNIRENTSKKSRSESKNHAKCRYCCESQNTDCSNYFH